MSNPSLEPIFAQALAHHQAGRLQQAELLYRQILLQHPQCADALHQLGMLAHQVGKNEIALDLVTRAIAINAGAAEYYNTLGEIQRTSKSSERAEQSYRQATELSPQTALFHSNLSLVLREQRKFSEALVAGKTAVELDPASPSAQLNLANALSDSGEYPQAIAHYRQAVALNPTDARILTSLGATFSEIGEFDQAMDCFDRAIALNDSPDAHLNRSFIQLVRGDFENGWNELEWRWRSTDFPSPRLLTPKPAWDGSHAAGKTILLFAEQGAGDAIQFIRYAPLVAQRSGGNVIVLCPAELKALFQAVHGVSNVTGMNEPLPAFDFYLPLVSQPRIFKTTAENIPAAIPYLTVDQRKALAWKDRISGATGRRVGLVWQGRTTHGNDRNRSIPLTTLAPLMQIENVQWISLQKGPAARHLAQAPTGTRLLDLSAEIQDYSDTAAIIANLDLIIGVDTSVIHLAGALGKPVWTLLPFSPDWRWMLDREDTPWYPTMRLLRQRTVGDWTPVISQAARMLERMS